jgi:hypothetical protein
MPTKSPDAYLTDKETPRTRKPRVARIKPVDTSLPGIGIVIVAEQKNAENISAHVKRLSQKLSGLQKLQYPGRIYIKVIEIAENEFLAGIQELVDGLPNSETISVVGSPKISFAEAVNLGLLEYRKLGVEYTLLTSGDEVPAADINLQPMVRIMEDDWQTGCIRLGIPSPMVEGRFSLVGGAWFVHLARERDNRLSFTHGPALYHQRFWDAFGKLPDGDKNSSELFFSRIISGISGPRTLYWIPDTWLKNQ